jgi:putative PEP-CTERM system TPR-repeat lipoprotein
MPSIRKKRTTVAIISGALILAACISGCSKTQTSETLVSEARKYQEKGDNKAAIIQLKNAIQKNPDDVDARYLLGTIYNETGDPKSAEKEIRKAISLGMNSSKALPALEKSLLMQGQFQKVLDETNQDQAAQSNTEIMDLRGNAYLALGKYPQAKEAFELSLKNKADGADALMGLAKYSMAQKDIDAATRFSEQAVTKHPKNIDAWLLKGDLLRAQGKVQPAIAAYDETLKLQPDNPVAHIVKANLEIGLRKFDEAKADIDAARKSTPNNPIVNYTQALLDFTQGKNAAALESVQQVLRVAPEHMPSILLAGGVQYALGSTQQAEQHLKKYLDKNPDNLYARKLLASTLLKNGQIQPAIKVLEPALTSAQQDPQVLMLIGQSYMQAKDFTKATESFEKASALAPKAAAIHTALGMSRLGQGESDRAVAELEKATDLDVKSPQAGVLLVMTHLRLKEYDKALAAVKALEKEQPDNPLLQNLKGGAYLGKEDITNARASFQKALTIQPTYFPAVANLAQLDIQEKKPDAAKKRLESFLEKDKKNVQAITALANLAVSMGQNDEAKVLLERASNENPEAVQPARLLVAHYLRMGEKQKGLDLAKKLQSTKPSSPDFLELLAQTQLANGDKSGALNSYGKLAAVMPESAPVQVRIASLYMSMQNDAAASEALKKALRLDPNYLDANLAVAGIEIRKGNYDEAISISRQVQKQQAKSPVGYAMEGDVLMMQKKPALAVKAYEQAFGIGKNGPMLIKLHGSLTQAGKSKEADARLAQWVKDHPADAATRMYLAQVYLMSRQNKAAIEQFQTVLKTDPKNAAALNNLALAYDQEKDPRALEYAEKAYQQAADNPAILDTLGWMLVEQGNTGRGLPLLQKAVSLAPDALDIRYHLVLGLVKSGDKSKARKELEQLLASGKPFSKTDEAKALIKQL